MLLETPKRDKAMLIQVVGIGCHICQNMEEDVRAIVSQMELEAQVERVDDVEKILQYGLFALPGLVIDGQMVTCGYSGKKKIERLIKEKIDNAELRLWQS
jgi:small redox-active disulfide protein 2